MCVLSRFGIRGWIETYYREVGALVAAYTTSQGNLPT